MLVPISVSVSHRSAGCAQDLATSSWRADPHPLESRLQHVSESERVNRWRHAVHYYIKRQHAVHFYIKRRHAVHYIKRRHVVHYHIKDGMKQIIILKGVFVLPV